MIAPILILIAAMGAQPPTVTTGSATSIQTTTAWCSGLITATGGASILERGVCWSVTPNPTVLDQSAEPIVVQGAYFECRLSGLEPFTTYHVRAYARNAVGTGYGQDIEFRTLRVNRECAYIGIGLRGVGL